MIHESIDIICDYQKAGIEKPDYQPTLHTYILDNYLEIQPFRKRPAVLICPGGGYEFTSAREGEHIALRMNALGFNSFILKYNCKPAVYPAPQLELATSIALIRENAAKWHIDPNKIIVAGFSAGGHLAASLGVFWKSGYFSDILGVKPARIRPDGLLLCYPVITAGKFAHRGSFRALLGDKYNALIDSVSLEKQVTSDTPPVFIWHTFEDATVPVENTLLFASALRHHKVPFELHVFQHGTHGLAAANEETMNAFGWGVQKEAQTWIDMAAAWIRNLHAK
jgi:acetyl esterase/lipase